jgi:prophage antirepressor-like protein
MDIVKAFTTNKLNIEITIKGTFEKPLFRASDIGNVLGLVNIHQSISDFEDHEKVIISTETLGGKQEVTFITINGLYELLARSKKPVAKQFKKWVWEVLEDIRLTGKYIYEDKIKEKDAIIENQQLALKQKEVELAKLQKRNKINYDNKDRVYVYEDITNDGEKVYKIGFSSNFNVRVQAYDGTRFENKLQFELECVNGKLLESVVHHMLRKYQDSEKKEWFHTNLELVKQAINASKLFLDNHKEQFTQIITILEDNTKDNTNEIKDDILDDSDMEDNENTVIKPENIDKDYSLYKRFIDECTIRGDDFVAIASDVSGLFRLWNKRSTKDERSTLVEFLNKTFKTSRKAIWNEEKKTYQYAYKGFKLIDYKYTSSNPPNEFDEFILDNCKVEYSSRVTSYDILNSYMQWKKENNKQITDEKREQYALSTYLAKKFIRITGKFIYKGKPESGGFWGLTLKNNNFNDACPVTQSPRKRKKVYKINPNTNEIVHEYNSQIECSQALDNDMYYRIKHGINHIDGFLYSYSKPNS